MTVLEADDVGKTLRIRVEGHEATLSHETASKVWVVEVASSPVR